MKYFVLLLITLMSLAEVNSADGSKRRYRNTFNQSKPKVRLQVFFESLCPDSRRFVVSQLKPTMEKIGGYVNLELNPYGKAKTNSTTGEIKCQHGENECKGNIIDACGISRLRSGSDQTQFVYCMFQTTNMSISGRGQYCSEMSNLDWENDMQRCVEGPEGPALHKQYGEETEHLEPPLTWVPLVILNHKRGDEDYQNTLTNYLFRETCAELTRVIKITS